MGLDMYLYDKKNTSLAYWRKANAIHHWFVENIQNGIDDCKPFPVSKEKLEELLHICEKVVANCKLVKGSVIDYYHFVNGKDVPHFVDGFVIKDPSVAKELLPVYRGFFFGSYEYDSYYLKDLNYTINTFKEILSTFDFEHNVLFYQSSW